MLYLVLDQVLCIIWNHSVSDLKPCLFLDISNISLLFSLSSFLLYLGIVWFMPCFLPAFGILITPEEWYVGGKNTWMRQILIDMFFLISRTQLWMESQVGKLLWLYLYCIRNKIAVGKKKKIRTNLIYMKTNASKIRWSPVVQRNQISVTLNKVKFKVIEVECPFIW